MIPSDIATLTDEVAGVLASALNITVEPDAVLLRSATPQWDSLRHVEIALLLEETFDVRFSAAQIAELTSSGAIVTVLAGMRG